MKGKRHPTIGNNVVIGARAVALGAITIGDGARVGAGSVVIKPVPSGATVVGVPGRIVEDHLKPIQDLEHGKLPDPVAEAISVVLKEQYGMEERLRKLEGFTGLIPHEYELENKRQEIEIKFSKGGGI